MKSPPGMGLLQSGDAAAPPPFNGNYASVLLNPYQVCQTDIGLGYGVTMFGMPGNVGSAVVQVSGALTGTGVPGPIWVRYLAGNTVDIYYDGIGVTPAMAGAPFVGPLPLTGLRNGLILTPSGGFVGGDTWKATSRGFTDQSGNGKHFTQPNSSLQPIITAGFNAKPGLAFDTDDFLESVISLPYPVTTLLVGRATSMTTSSSSLIGGESPYQATIISLAAGEFTQYSGGPGVQGIPATLATQLFIATYTNSPSDSFQVGNSPVSTGTNTGDHLSTSRVIGAITSAARKGNCEVFMVACVPPQDLTAFIAALNSPQGYGPGNVLTP